MTLHGIRDDLPGFATLVGAAILLVVLAAVSVRTGEDTDKAQRSDDTVVATLQTSATRHSPELLESLRASRAAPDNLALAKAAARQLIDEGRAQGESRLVGAAIGVLRGFMDAPDAETLYLEATARQYQHDFTGALALLDRAAQKDPRDVNVRLMRATLHTVLGRFDLARADCRRITVQGRPQVGLLCRATALLLTSNGPAIARQLDAVLAQPERLSPVLYAWAAELSGEIAGLQGDDAKARARLETALSATPTNIRTRLLLADVLLRQGAPDAVLDLLANAPDVDGVLVRRVLAARQADAPEIASAARDTLAGRVQRNLDLGLTAHAREETMYFLWIADQPAMALERAEVNWGLQHEIEDAQLLIDAAIAADSPAAAAPVLDWMEAQDVAASTLRIPASVRKAAEP